MRKSIKRDGIRAFMDDEYEREGGFHRLTEVLEFRWPRTVIGKEFRDANRETVRTWIKAMVLEGLWDEAKYGPALLIQSSKTS